ncbi:MAG: hypothetical protein D6757_09285 [Alphaproteobacteria bacterium]|nr:MAG: hypothetical protein D6757_09285 [Alphaproteobacteria bacterium]
MKLRAPVYRSRGKGRLYEPHGAPSPFAGRLLPLLMVLLAIFLSYRVERLLSAFGISAFDSPSVHAEESPPEAKDASNDKEGQTGAAGHEAGPSDADSGQTARENAASPMEGSRLSRSERDIVQDLRKRREDLVERENRVALREQLLAATERRIKNELDELKRVKQEIRALLAEQDAKQNEKLRSLVKVYETMKPKDAARIFERLDMKIQISVARQMKEAKMAALLANMNPEAARKLTTELATPRKVPDLDAILEGKKSAAQ